MSVKNLLKVNAGRKGGLSTLKKYGVDHFRRLGQWGAHRMHATYRLEPVDRNDFAIVNRATGEVKAFLSGKPV